jgi:hypothetical protein
MIHENEKRFESEEFLLQISNDHLLYAEKDDVRFDFRNIAKLRIYRQKRRGTISKITYRMKGKLGAFQIDGFGDVEMEQIASLLKARAMEYSIDCSETEMA